MYKFIKKEFKYYIDCPKSLWFLINNFSVFPVGEYSSFA